MYLDFLSNQRGFYAVRNSLFIGGTVKTSKSAFEIPLITSNDRTGFLRYPPSKLKGEKSNLLFLYNIILEKMRRL